MFFFFFSPNPQHKNQETDFSSLVTALRHRNSSSKKLNNVNKKPVMCVGNLTRTIFLTRTLGNGWTVLSFKVHQSPGKSLRHSKVSSSLCSRLISPYLVAPAGRKPKKLSSALSCNFAGESPTHAKAGRGGDQGLLSFCLLFPQAKHRKNF